MPECTPDIARITEQNVAPYTEASPNTWRWPNLPPTNWTTRSVSSDGRPFLSKRLLDSSSDASLIAFTRKEVEGSASAATGNVSYLLPIPEETHQVDDAQVHLSS